MKPEDKIRALAKQYLNTICPNCGAKKKFGFGAVCMKYKTFVCNECKQSHQAVSHRMKSVSMSYWSEEEVREVEMGGNELCRQTWLKNAPPLGVGGRPDGRPGQPPCNINVYKKFIIDVYEHKKYYGERDENAPQIEQQQDESNIPRKVQPSAASRRRKERKQKQLKPVSAPVVKQKAPVKAAAPAPVMDLLDLSFSPSPTTSGATTSIATSAAPNTDLFQQAPSSTTPIAPNTDLFQQAPSSNSTSTASNTNLFDANFNAFQTSTAPIATSSAPDNNGMKKSTIGSDPFSPDFSDFQTVLGSTPSQNQPPKITTGDNKPNNGDFSSFAAFDNTAKTNSNNDNNPTSQQHSKKPIMNSSPMNGNASNITAASRISNMGQMGGQGMMTQSSMMQNQNMMMRNPATSSGMSMGMMQPNQQMINPGMMNAMMNFQQQQVQQQQMMMMMNGGSGGMNPMMNNSGIGMNSMMNNNSMGMNPMMNKAGNGMNPMMMNFSMMNIGQQNFMNNTNNVSLNNNKKKTAF